MVMEATKDQYYINAKGEKKNLIKSGDTIIKLDMENTQKIFSNQEKYNKLMTELYKVLGDKTYKEYIGIYEIDDEGISQANRETYKIITFVQE